MASKVEYLGKKVFIDPETGNRYEMDYVKKTLDPRLKGGWNRVYIGLLLEALDEIGNAKIKVLSYIVENVDNNNKIGKSILQISKEAKVNYKTTHQTIKALIDKGVLKKIDNFIVVMPNVISVFGSDAKNARLLTEYTTETEPSLFDELEENEANAIEANAI